MKWLLYSFSFYNFLSHLSISLFSNIPNRIYSGILIPKKMFGLMGRSPSLPPDFLQYTVHSDSACPQSFPLRTLPARLAPHSVPRSLLLFGGKNHRFFTPSHTFQHGISTGLNLIDWFWSSANTILCHVPMPSIYVVSWSRNFVLKVKEWRFLTHRWVGGREKKCVSKIPNRAPHVRYIWILSCHFRRLLFI